MSLTPFDVPRIIKALDIIAVHAPTTKSDFAREYADQIARLASMNLITVKVNPDIYGRRWRITQKGMDELDEYLWCVDEDRMPV